MPLGNLALGALAGARVTYQPFPLPPAEVLNAQPIKEGVFGYSSLGLSVMGTLPKRPSELLTIMSEQYEEPEVDRFGRPCRGGRGKKKGKIFFQAHLTWYNVEYNSDDSRDELEDRLWAAMSTRPPPTLGPEMYGIEAEMRQRWSGATRVEQARVVERLTAQGHTVNNCDLLANLTNPPSLTDEFFANPNNFFRTHFPADVSDQHVVVLLSVDENAGQEVWKWACIAYRLKVEKVDNDRGRGRQRGHFPDFVIGKDAAAVRAKANELRGDNGQAGGVRFRPY